MRTKTRRGPRRGPTLTREILEAIAYVGTRLRKEGIDAVLGWTNPETEATAVGLMRAADWADHQVRIRAERGKRRGEKSRATPRALSFLAAVWKTGDYPTLAAALEVSGLWPEDLGPRRLFLYEVCGVRRPSLSGTFWAPKCGGILVQAGGRLAYLIPDETPPDVPRDADPERVAQENVARYLQRCGLQVVTFFPEAELAGSGEAPI